jgi:flagellar biosynthesis protein FliR
MYNKLQIRGLLIIELIPRIFKMIDIDIEIESDGEEIFNLEINCSDKLNKSKNKRDVNNKKINSSAERFLYLLSFTIIMLVWLAFSVTAIALTVGIALGNLNNTLMKENYLFICAMTALVTVGATIILLQLRKYYEHAFVALNANTKTYSAYVKNLNHTKKD